MTAIWDNGVTVYDEVAGTMQTFFVYPQTSGEIIAAADDGDPVAIRLTSLVIEAISAIETAPQDNPYNCICCPHQIRQLDDIGLTFTILPTDPQQPGDAGAAPRGVRMNADDIPLTISWFSTATPDGGPALGDPELTTWAQFCGVSWFRREGIKDGPCFATARFTMEPDGRQVRRLKANLVARTAIALDIEANKRTGEIPPDPDEAIRRAEEKGLACLLYTSHSHRAPDTIRYRMVFPLSQEIDPELPAPIVVAEFLGLDGTLDASKIGAQSLFYLPSCPDGMSDAHQEIIVPGAPVDAAWLTAALGARQIEADRIAGIAQAEATARREAKIAAGFDAENSLIEKLRSHFDLDTVLTAHGYDRQGAKYRHPNSSSGCFGADIKTFGGIPRIYSHNATDPLHADNLPDWCTVTALDAVDVVTILDFAGDRQRALRELAQRFNLDKAAERRRLSQLIFRLIKRQATQEQIEADATAEGQRLGLSYEEVCGVARWVAWQCTQSREAA
jgi:hypothetical protein